MLGTEGHFVKISGLNNDFKINKLLKKIANKFHSTLNNSIKIFFKGSLLLQKSSETIFKSVFLQFFKTVKAIILNYFALFTNGV